jgi:hypothetical protein
MRRMTVGLVVMAVVGCAVQVSGQCTNPDPFDDVLCVGVLTPTEESQFSATDNAVSPFWAGLSGDYVELIPPDDCYPGSCNFSGPTDGSMLLKAAGTGRGIYLYVEVQDNVWVDPAGPDRCCDDSVDLYFDKLDANTIWTCADCLIGLYDSRLSYTTQQLQVFMGASTAPSTFRLASYDPNMWSWTTVNLSWADAKAQYGFEAEVVTVDATHRVQEWFVPWEKYGTGLVVGSLLDGMLMAFAGGYNDLDGDSPDHDALRWPNGKDPWIGDQNYWGDIMMASGMGTVQSVVGVKRPEAPARAVAAARPVASGDLFTLRGERLPAGRAGTRLASGVVVQRAGGNAVARCVGGGI